MKLTSVKESLTSFADPSVSFIPQLLFTLSTTLPYRKSFCSTHASWVLLFKMHLPKCSFRCWEVEDINCSDQDLCQPEVEFLSLQPVTSDDMSEEVSKEAVMAMNSMQSFTESKFFGTTWDFKKFQVPLDQSFINCSTSCEWFYALFTATQKKSRFFHVLRKIWPHSMCL